MTFLDTLRSAFVIARRDFRATVFSKTFIFFLVGPLFPLSVGLLFGQLGNRIEKEADAPIVAVVMPPDDAAAIEAARMRLLPLLGGGDRPPIALERIAPKADGDAQRRAILSREERPVIGVLDGTLAAPHFASSGSEDGRAARTVAALVDNARREGAAAPASAGPALAVSKAKNATATREQAREVTARLGQGLQFLLTLLLAGMLLSQLVEEKSNKVIEILAASVPIDAIFLGKLSAMLAASLCGIAVWGVGGVVALNHFYPGGLSSFPEPAVGWPLFGFLFLAYFVMSYLLLGAAFLGIGAQASTVREVQTLSMPVTMSQMLLFAWCTAVVGKPESREGIAAAIFPFSSPFAMNARAALQDAVWPHLLALAWQAIWVAIILRIASSFFRRAVLKSGPALRWPWQRADR